MCNKKVLVIDDEEAILLAFKKLLTRLSVDVDTCESKEDAFALLNQYIYDFVIADLRLSGTLGQEGYEIIETVKQKSPSTKIALITAYGNYGIKEKAFKCGADFYFEKPVSMKSIYEILEN